MIWDRQPALFIGFNLLSAAAFALTGEWPYLIPLIAMWAHLTYTKSFQLLLQGMILSAAFFLYTLFLYPANELPKECSGVGYFSISSVKEAATPFNKSLQYKGSMLHFIADSGKAAKNLSCSLFLPLRAPHPPADHDYIMKGKLIRKSSHYFLFKPEAEWNRVESSFSPAEMRHQAKKAVHTYLKKHITNHRSLTFLAALCTEEIDDRGLSMEFNRLGLQHLLAISGFDFALLALFLGLFIRPLLSPRISALAILCFLTAYFLFLGGSPPIQRAWLAIAVLLVATLLDKECTGLNALGAALTISLLIDPLVITQIGFQLSFLCTLAIFIAYPLVSRMLDPLLPLRPLYCLATMTRGDQIGYLLSATLREASALNIAVHLFSIPVVLYHFQQFPLLSLLYNLFFPFWVSISLILLFTSFVLSALIPPLGHLLHQCNSSYTAALLELTAHPPASCNFILYSPPIPLLALMTFLTLLILSSLWLREKEHKDALYQI